jgi:hypothetical protein
MRLSNKFNLPDQIVNAIKNDPYNPGPCDMSVTTLISPPRQVELKRRHHKEITEDVSDRIWSLFGQGIHTALERAEADATTEARLSIERQGWVISGQLDYFDATTGLLCDYKVTSCYAIKNGHRKEWEAQLNILATLLREHGYKVTGIKIVTILRDWSNSMAQRSRDYPECPVVTIDVPLWSQERCEEFIDERIRIHQAARETLPECSAEERWATPDVWALMKEGRKTAVKLFELEDEAEAACKAAGDKHSLVLRPGKSIRCESYCPAAPFCEQRQRGKAALVE